VDVLTADKTDPMLLQEIKEHCGERLLELLEQLGVDTSHAVVNDRELRMSCPIHEGDNASAFCYNFNTNLWLCFTAGCHQTYQPDIIGLVQALLQKNGKLHDFRTTVNYLMNFLGIAESSYKTDLRLFGEISQLKRKASQNQLEQQDGVMYPLSIMDNVEPSRYFLDMGFEERILRHFYISDCYTKYKPMYMRAFAPVINTLGNAIVGFTGRTLYPLCHLCGEYHRPNAGCPTENHLVKATPKWKHIGFQSGRVMYNFHEAKSFITRTRTAIIVEGPKDLWWLKQHGIDNAIGIFGLNLTNKHIEDLLKCGTHKIVMCLDNDKYGQLAIHKIQHQTQNLFQLKDISTIIDKNSDVADISTEDMYQTFIPRLMEL
jgi:DNA primase